MPSEESRLQRFECIFTHKTGLTRRVFVYAVDGATAEAMAWVALTHARAWRPTWSVAVGSVSS